MICLQNATQHSNNTLYRAEEEVEMPLHHRYSACLYLNKHLTFHKSGNDSLILTVNLFCKLEEAPTGTYGVLFDHQENKALRHCQKSPSGEKLMEKQLNA